MACSRQTLTNAEREAIEACNKRADELAKCMVAKAAEETKMMSPVPKPIPVY